MGRGAQQLLECACGAWGEGQGVCAGGEKGDVSWWWCLGCMGQWMRITAQRVADFGSHGGGQDACGASCSGWHAAVCASPAGAEDGCTSLVVAGWLLHLRMHGVLPAVATKQHTCVGWQQGCQS